MSDDLGSGPFAHFFYVLTARRPDGGHLERLHWLEDRVEPTLEALGFDVVRVAITGSGGRRTLQVMADRRDGAALTVDDCEQISQTLSTIFDVEDPIPGTYDLEVSSAGIDRPLTRPKDFATYAGCQVKVETKAPVVGRKRFRGVLKGMENGNSFAVHADGADVTIALSNVNQAKLVLTDELIAATAKRTSN